MNIIEEYKIREAVRLSAYKNACELMSLVFLMACRKEYRFGTDRLNRIKDSVRDMLIAIDKQELTFEGLQKELLSLGIDLDK